MQRRLGSMGIVAAAVLLAGSTSVGGQATSAPPAGELPDKVGGSTNVHLVGHVPLGGYFRTADADLEQELSRPYAYVAQRRDRTGFSILDLKDPNNIKVL
jgi:hypothetical protein